MIADDKKVFGSLLIWDSVLLLQGIWVQSLIGELVTQLG